MGQVLTGIGVSPGVAAGPVARMAALPVIPDQLPAPSDPAAESAVALAALEAVASDLELRGAKAGGEAAGVLVAQAMIARDPSLGDKVTDRISAGAPAIVAIREAFEEFRAMLAAAGPYMAERVADLDDIRNRAYANVLGLPMPGVPELPHPYVLVAEDLAPADTATLDSSRVLAIITQEGGPTSHTAILAKSLGIPAVVACAEAVDLIEGSTVLVNGGDGIISVSPDSTVIDRALAAEATARAVLAKAKGPGRTSDGHPVQLLVNIAGDRDLESAAAADSEGVGLFRTEFLFLDRTTAPTEQEQEEVYRRVFDAFTGRKVVVRTLDAGADKPLPFVTADDEPNPALGVRGLRTSRRVPELLESQLRAIAAAAAGSGATVWVMAPMVSVPSEAADFAASAHRAGISSAGSMVEVPAAALRSQAVTAACDFVSIGTNDLSQYTYAADRMIGALADLLDPWQPGLLELVRLTAAGARANGKPVGVCGEAASDPLLSLVLVGLGVNSLSMAPVSLPAVRATLAVHSLAACRGLAAVALEAEDGRAARAAVRAAAAHV